ncbi:MAG: hypothetical protein WCW16_02160 [Candidatus Magasanikbacteria bacterium]
MKRKTYTNFGQRLFLSQLYLDKLLDMTDLVLTGYLAIGDRELNGIYMLIKSYLQSMLDFPEFDSVKRDLLLLLPDDLISDLQEKNIVWEHDRILVEKCLAQIEKEYILVGSPKFSLSEDDKEIFDYINNLLKKRRENKKHSNKKFVDYLKEEKKKVDLINDSFDDNKLTIHITSDSGIWRIERGKKLQYSIKGNRRKIIDFLSNKKLSGKELSELLLRKKNAEFIGKEISNINKIFLKKMQIEKSQDKKRKLIISLPTGGYALNKEEYDISFH